MPFDQVNRIVTMPMYSPEHNGQSKKAHKSSLICLRQLGLAAALSVSLYEHCYKIREDLADRNEP